MSQSVAMKKVGKFAARVSALAALALVSACSQTGQVPSQTQAKSNAVSTNSAGLTICWFGPCGGGSSGSPVYADGSRLVGHYWSGQDGAHQFEGSWYDTTRDEDCKLACDESGVTRCMPFQNTANISVYSDSQCTQPAAAVFAGEEVPTYLHTSTQPTSPNCSTDVTLYKVGAAVNCSQLYVKSGGSCVAADWGDTAPASCWTSTVIPASTFVSFTRQ